MIINISDAKTQLSKLIDRVCHGEKIIISKNNQPLVELVKHKTPSKRALGLLRGEISIPDDFDVEDAEINEMFHGKSE